MPISIMPFAMGIDELSMEDKTKLGIGPLPRRERKKTHEMDLQELNDFGADDKEWLDKINALAMRFFSAKHASK